MRTENLLQHKILLNIFIAIFSIVILSCNGSQPNEPNSSNDRLQTIRSFHSNILGNYRNIRIYLPASYNSSDQFYPVLYLQDGQGMFAPGGWRVENTYDSLVQTGAIKEVILVSIDNSSNRLAEYIPPPPYGYGNADQYLKFLTEEVIPYIGSHYRVKDGPENTAVLGSSAGGVFAFYAAWARPDIFSMSASMSPSFWIYDKNFLRTIQAYTGSKKQIKYWIDAGNFERGDPDHNGLDEFVEDAYDITVRLIELGWRYGSDLLFDVDYQATHDEIFWRRRIFKPLIFFFGVQSNTVTNLSARTSVPALDNTNNVPNAMLMVKASWDTGLSAEVPFNELNISSAQAGKWSADKSGRIVLVPGAVTSPSTIQFDIRYCNKYTYVTLAAVPVLSPTVQVNLTVEAPFSSGNRIYMVGSIPELGGWNPIGGFVLDFSNIKGETKIYKKILAVARNSLLRFKFCAGPSWDYVELNGSGGEIPDRFQIANEDFSFNITVLEWKKVP